jgi:hypothetical protein
VTPGAPLAAAVAVSEPCSDPAGATA